MQMSTQTSLGSLQMQGSDLGTLVMRDQDSMRAEPLAQVQGDLVQVARPLDEVTLLVKELICAP